MAAGSFVGVLYRRCGWEGWRLSRGRGCRQRAGYNQGSWCL